MNVVALKLSERAKTKNYAYGLGKVQGFAAIFEGIIVFSSGVFLTYNGIINFINHKSPEVTLVEIGTMLIALFGTGIIMWNFLRISKVSNSLLIKSDALHYSSDLFMNGGILVALIASKVFGFWWCDAVFAIGIGLWIIKNALPIIYSGISMLLDHSLDPEAIKKIEKIIKQEEAIESFHYLKTRKSGDETLIEAHIVFKNKQILLFDAHKVSEDIEEKISQKFPGSSITLHLDLDDTPEKYTQK